MKRELIYLLLAAGVIFSGGLPFVSRDVGELRPVQTALIRMEEEQVILETDLGDRGIGTDWSSAMADLEAKAPGAVFIGPASFLLLEDGASALLPELAKQTELNPGCALCLAPAEVDLEAVSLYLNAHEPDWNLDRLRQAQAAGEPVELPRLTEVDGGYLLVQPGD